MFLSLHNTTFHSLLYIYLHTLTIFFSLSVTAVISSLSNGYSLISRSDFSISNRLFELYLNHHNLSIRILSVMDRNLRPERFDGDPNLSGVSSQCDIGSERSPPIYGKSIVPEDEKMDTLINFISHTVYNHINECEFYDHAVTVLESLFVEARK